MLATFLPSAAGGGASLTLPNEFLAAQVVTLTALGTTPTPGFTLRNTTAAAAGAQQVSPSTVWEGRGWKTDVTAASQAVAFRAHVLPVQGAAAPSATWVLGSSINGGAYTDLLSVTSTGSFAFSGSLVVAAGNSITWAGRGGISASGDGIFQVFSNGFSKHIVLEVEANHVLAQKNAANPQSFRVYGNATGSHYIDMSHNGTDGVLSVNGGGTLLITSLPTANPGPGFLWNNAGTPAIGT
jgi:hypothetical protein